MAALFLVLTALAKADFVNFQIDGSTSMQFDVRCAFAGDCVEERFARGNDSFGDSFGVHTFSVSTESNNGIAEAFLDHSLTVGANGIAVLDIAGYVRAVADPPPVIGGFTESSSVARTTYTFSIEEDHFLSGSWQLTDVDNGAAVLRHILPSGPIDVWSQYDGPNIELLLPVVEFGYYELWYQYQALVASRFGSSTTGLPEQRWNGLLTLTPISAVGTNKVPVAIIILLGEDEE